MINLKTKTHSFKELFHSSNTFLLDEQMSYESFFLNCKERARGLNLDTTSTISITIDNSYIDLELLFALWLCGKSVVLHSNTTPALERTKKDQSLGAKKLSDIYNSEKIISNDFNLESVACYIFTSGSEDTPKAIALSFKNLFFSASNYIDFYKIREDHFLPITLPLYHVGGLLICLRALLAKAPTQILRPGKIESHLFKKAPDFLSVVPTQMDRILNNLDNIDFFKKTNFILGGAKSSKKTLDGISKNSITASSTYGMTETTAMCMATELTSDPEILKTVGKPFPNILVSLSKDQTIVVRGDCVAPQFEDKTIRTKDIGIINSDGNFSIEGRADDVFLSGGENINPLEIENILIDNQINSPCIVPIDDEVLQNKSVLFHDSNLNELQVREICKNALHPHKVPRHIFKLPPFAKGGIKLKKNFLKTLANTYLNLEAASEIFPSMYEGDPRNKWIILIHGFMGKKEDWVEVINILKPDHFVIAIDCPGHGENTISESFTIEDFQKDFTNFSYLLNHSFTLLGYSQGGRLALGLSLLELPLDSLIIESASAGIEDEMERERRYKSDQTMFQKISSKNELQSFLEYWYSNSIFGEISHNPKFPGMIKSKLDHNPAQWQLALNTFSVGRQENYRYRLNKIKELEKLTITGSDDHKYLAQSKELEMKFKFKFQAIPKTSHNTHFENPTTFSEHIREFLKNLK